MNNYTSNKLENFIEYLYNCEDFDNFKSVILRIKIFLTNVFSNEVKEDFLSIAKIDTPNYFDWQQNREEIVGFLESIIALSHDKLISEPTIEIKSDIRNEGRIQTNAVFIVHGHDNEVKETVARYVDNIGLDPIILHEKPNQGDTIIEKFEKYSDVRFAIVLLTPDDICNSKVDDEVATTRARQNVILELGYFLSKLGRANVFALKKDNVEIPSDYHGILYVEFDNNGAWKQKLAQELVESGIKINLEGLLK
ncbi:MAG: nucleotide-binding protein [Erysipelotrichaceae bacterium]|nr:nucleotide-binding protein [Ignavibacteriales bacterium]MCB9499681.1 nucleotide-binding protein [Erysipelotrichaceae bacterium]